MLYVSLKTNNYCPKTALPRVINYALGSHNICGLYGATGMSLDTSYMVDSMKELKKDYRKPGGRLLLHLVVSFDKNDSELLTPQNALELGYLFADELVGYQTVFGIHDDTENLHIHYVINSVNYITGLKNGLSHQMVYCRYNTIFNNILIKYKQERFGIGLPHQITSLDDFENVPYSESF